MQLDQRHIKGRGALTNRSGRFEPLEHHVFDDGWESLAEAAGERPATRVERDSSRKVITYNRSPDLPFDRSINPYRGCEHGCIYCFARPSHAYLGLSPGLDFETRLFAKPDAAIQLERELARPGYRVQPILLGANTDPYQPVEREHRLTRQILEVLERWNHPLTLVTKSDRVTRDLDLLSALAERDLVQVMVSVTTLKPGLARRLEPRAAAPARRLAAISALASAGVPVGVFAAPMIPAINDEELEAILEAAAAAGASVAGYTFLRLPLEIADLFEEWLETHFPERKERVLSLIRSARGGKLYDPRWGKRMTGEGPYAALIRARFKAAARRLGLDRHRWSLDTSRFAPPAEAQTQLSLL